MPPDVAPTRRDTASLSAAAGATLLSIASIWVVELSSPALLACLIAGIMSAALTRPTKWVVRVFLGAASIAALVDVGRFARGKAMTGIVEAGQRATSKSAIWRLREVVIAEDGLRKIARIDPDRDRVGSADFIGALAGIAPHRHGIMGDPPLLNYRYRHIVETAEGPAADVGSHLLIVCLPTPSGGLTARPGDLVDDEAAERRFVAYAWPSDAAPDVSDVVFIDEHERILLLATPESPYRGVGAPPPCDAADRAPQRWKAWQDKKPRSTLPGERPR
jgi:hypothetical protein